LLKQLASVLTVLPAPHKTQVIRHMVIEPPQQSSSYTDALLASLDAQLERTDEAIDLLNKRQSILDAALRRYEELVQTGTEIHREEVEVKGKKKQKSKTTEDKPCGWDRRLIWDDEEVEAWDRAGAGEEEVEVCTLGKRKCDRHSG
jgi:COMPASS component SPP1